MIFLSETNIDISRILKYMHRPCNEWWHVWYAFVCAHESV